MTNQQYGQIETLKGEGVELTLIQGNDCIHYGLEGQDISSDVGIWTGDRQSLIESELSSMGLKVENGKIVADYQ